MHNLPAFRNPQGETEPEASPAPRARPDLGGRSYWLVSALVAGAFAALCVSVILIRAADPAKAAKLTEQDASHYVHMATVFRSGNWSLPFLREGPMPERGLAHRQFLYPVLLAGALTIHDSLVSMAMVNVALGVLAILGFSRLARRLLPSRLALLSTAAFGLHPFLIEYAAKYLLSELSFITAAVYTYLFLVRGREWRPVRNGLAAGAFAALSYLARPTGLFLMISVVAVTLVGLAIKRRRTDLVGLGTFVAAAVLVAAPSWAARLHYHGNPIYHAYLPNFMWHDVFEEAQSPGPPRYGPAEYFATHTVWGAAWRMVRGVARVFLWGTVIVFFSFYAVWICGFLASLMERRLGYLTAVMAVQLVPFVWTSEVNPSIRLYYAPMLPFLALYFAVGLVWVGRAGAEAAWLVRRGLWCRNLGGGAIVAVLALCAAEAIYWIVRLARVP